MPIMRRSTLVWIRSHWREDCVYTIVDIDIPVVDNALPAITSQITINGNGAIITRSTAPVTPQFRLLYIGNGGNLISTRRLFQTE